MLFSAEYGISKTADDDWFDPILDNDTKLFVDPFLIFRNGNGVFADAHTELIKFFEMAFKLAAESGGKHHHPAYKKLLAMLTFPEVNEIRLGYASTGRGGAGTARGFAKVIVAAIFQSIALGITKFEHFEEIGVFNEGIGCDRISDITANILKKQLIAYTHSVCVRHGVPTQLTMLKNCGFDYTYMMWDEQRVKLPFNKYRNEGVLLVPSSFLRRLPVISAEEFWDYVWEDRGEQIRHDFNYEVKSRVGKRDIIRLARDRRFLVREYVKYAEGRMRPIAYDLARDASGLYQWERESGLYVSKNPISITAQSDAEFNSFLEVICEQYKHFIELNSGYKLLWDDLSAKSKSEESAQLLFLGIVKHYCRANNIDLSRETNIGRGPVDFKFSSGYSNRALLEVKLARNSKFWNGLGVQLPEYMRAEHIDSGIFLVICYTSNELKRTSAAIQRRLLKVSTDTGFSIRSVIIDATKGKPSASKMTK